MGEHGARGLGSWRSATETELVLGRAERPSDDSAGGAAECLGTITTGAGSRRAANAGETSDSEGGDGRRAEECTKQECKSQESTTRPGWVVRARAWAGLRLSTVENRALLLAPVWLLLGLGNAKGGMQERSRLEETVIAILEMVEGGQRVIKDTGMRTLPFHPSMKLEAAPGKPPAGLASICDHDGCAAQPLCRARSAALNLGGQS